MNIQCSGNMATLSLGHGERFYFLKRIQVERAFEREFPPFMFGAPIGRLLGHSYFFRFVDGNSAAGDVRFTGDDAVGEFAKLQLAPSESVIVDPRGLVGFCGKIRRIATDLGGLRSANFWCLGDPLPMRVEGPGWLLLYGPRLHWRNLQLLRGGPASEVVNLDQVVVFPSTFGVQAIALDPRTTPLGILENVLFLETRCAFYGTGTVLVRDVNRAPKLGINLKGLIQHLTILAALWLAGRGGF